MIIIFCCFFQKKGIDCQPYHVTDCPITWKNCSLRQWLNNDFLNKTFSSQEQILLAPLVLANDNNPVFGTFAGGETKDKVFLPDFSQIETYLSRGSNKSGSSKPGMRWYNFSDASLLKSEATDYAKKQGAAINNQTNLGSYWLRLPGNDENFAGYVCFDGSICLHGQTVTSKDCMVRPVICLCSDI